MLTQAITENAGWRLDASELISFTLGIVVDSAEIYSMTPVLMTLTTI